MEKVRYLTDRRAPAPHWDKPGIDGGVELPLERLHVILILGEDSSPRYHLLAMGTGGRTVSTGGCARSGAR